MASFDDLGRALRDDAAANAPDPSVIDLDAVTRAARARRRPRQWAVGALGLVAVLGVGSVAVAAATPPSLIAAGESADLESAGAEELGAPERDGGSPAVAEGLLSCGAVAPAPGQGLTGLALEADLPSGASTGSELMGTARIVSTDAQPRDLITGTEARAVILQDGVVVGESPVVDQAARSATLEPGGSLTIPVRLSTSSCLDGAPLPPGEYTVLTVIDASRSFDEPPSLLIAPEAVLRLE
jgi:hypothetical protein